MSQVNVEDMSREALEEAVISQARQLKTQAFVLMKLKKSLEESEKDYDELSTKILQARQVLSC